MIKHLQKALFLIGLSLTIVCSGNFQRKYSNLESEYQSLVSQVEGIEPNHSVIILKNGGTFSLNKNQKCINLSVNKPPANSWSSPQGLRWSIIAGLGLCIFGLPGYWNRKSSKENSEEAT